MSNPVERMYGRFFNPYLNPTERLLDAIPAISEMVADIDRSDREGTLGVTNERLLFVSMRGEAWHRYGLLAIRSVETGRIVMPPGNAWLIVHPHEMRTARFMVGKKQVARFLPLIESEMRRVLKENGPY
jgi:hypothetical protein